METISREKARRISGVMGPAIARPAVILAGILAVAFALRIYRITNNLPDYPGFDESEIVERAFAVGGGELNPHFFKWPGTLLIYANTAAYVVYFAVGWLVGWFDSLPDFQRAYQNDPTAFYVLGRLLVIAAALATIVLVFVATLRLGLAGAATAGLLIAVSPIHVRQSATVYPDVPATLFLVATVLAVKGFRIGSGTMAFAVSGLLMGLGTAIKYYVVVGAIGIVCEAMLAPVSWRRRAQLVAVAAAASVAGFVVGCPFSVLAFGEFSKDLLYQLNHQSRGHLGWEAAGNPAIWYGRNSLLPAMGLPALLAACFGVASIVRHHKAFTPLLATAAAYFLLATISNVSAPHYAIPHVPMLSVAAAAAVWYLRRQPWLARLLVIGTVAFPAVAAIEVSAERGREDPRAAAARWVQANIPASARVLSSYDGPLIAATLKVSRFRPITEDQWAVVAGRGIDVFVLMDSTTTLMQTETVLKNHAEIARSHLRLYEWVKAHATLEAAFGPGSGYKGRAVEVFVLPNVIRRVGPDGSETGREP